MEAQFHTSPHNGLTDVWMGLRVDVPQLLHPSNGTPITTGCQSRHRARESPEIRPGRRAACELLQPWPYSPNEETHEKRPVLEPDECTQASKQHRDRSGLNIRIELNRSVPKLGQTKCSVRAVTLVTVQGVHISNGFFHKISLRVFRPVSGHGVSSARGSL